MKQAEVIVVTLSSGDAALFVNAELVLEMEISNGGSNPVLVGEHLTKALGVELQKCSMDAPIDEDWNWNDVYELLPPRKRAADSVRVKHWDAYNAENTVPTHQFDVDDQRHSNGQMYATIGTIEGNPDDMLSVTLEVNSNPLNGIDHVPCAYVHFDSDKLAVSLFKIGNKILVRPEADVLIHLFRDTAFGAPETLY